MSQLKEVYDHTHDRHASDIVNEDDASIHSTVRSDDSTHGKKTSLSSESFTALSEKQTSVMDEREHVVIVSCGETDLQSTEPNDKVVTYLEQVNQTTKHDAKTCFVRASNTSRVTKQDQSTASTSGEASNRVVKKVILLQPDDDPEQVTADVMKQITMMLDKEAAEQIALGRLPDKETVIEITGIRVKSDKHIPCPRQDSVCLETSPSLMLPQERKSHRRKSSHSKHYMYHTSSSVQLKPKTMNPQLTNDDCYFQHRTHHCTSHKTASSNLLGRNSTMFKSGSMPNTTGMKRPKPAILRSAHWSVSTGINVQNKAIASATSVLPEASCTTNVLPGASTGKAGQCLIGTTVPNTEKNLEDTNKLDRSSPNIRSSGSLSDDMVGIIRLKDTPSHHIQLADRKCVHSRRPPFSYMNLILMAICDDPNKCKTLKQIYQWIEEKFPYYRYCANQSWKNSIRQNLSLCDIFINEKSQGKFGRSYWRLNTSMPLASTYIQNSQAKLMHALSSEQDNKADRRHGCHKTHTCALEYDRGLPETALLGRKQPSKKKAANKAPIPLLPKVQTYAPLSVQNIIPVFLQPAVIVSSVSVTCDSKVTGDVTNAGVMLEQVADTGGALPNVFCPADQCLDSAFSGPAQHMTTTSKSGVDLHHGVMPSGSIFQTRPGLESACKLLAKEEVRPEGLRTPPPMSGSDVLPKSSLKHQCSPTEMSRNLQTKHIKVVQEMDVYDHRTKKQLLSNQVAPSASASTSGLMTGRNSPSGSMDSTDLSSLLSQVAFSDSGFVSDCSSSELRMTKKAELSKPKIYDKAISESDDFTQCLPSESDLKVEETSLSELDLEAMDVSDLLWSPPGSTEMDSYLTSTPFREDADDLTPVDGDCDIDLVTPSFSDSMTSTPLHCNTPNDDTVSMGNSPKNANEAHWELPSNYIVDEGVHLDMNFSTFE